MQFAEQADKFQTRNCSQAEQEAERIKERRIANGLRSIRLINGQVASS